MSVQRLSQHCAHDSGSFIFESGSQAPLCADCGAPMVWVSAEYLDSLRRTPSEVEAALREQLEHEHSHLLSMYHTLANILMSRGRL